MIIIVPVIVAQLYYSFLNHAHISLYIRFLQYYFHSHFDGSFMNDTNLK